MEISDLDSTQFGYPQRCSKCSSISSEELQLTVEPFFQRGRDKKLMLVGQDPTIFKNKEKVKKVLMLDQDNGQLSRWLKSFLGEKNFKKTTIYATNLVKCSFHIPPSKTPEGGYNFLSPYFENCQEFLKAEIKTFRPHLLLTFGGPAHRHISSIFDETGHISRKMKEAFNGKLHNVRVDGFEFKYTPCLHIKTFRVADTYCDSVSAFKSSIAQSLCANESF